VAAESQPAKVPIDHLRRAVPVVAMAVWVVAVATDASSAAGAAVALVPVAGLAWWAWTTQVPVAALAGLVLVPVVVAQHGGALEPTLFEVSLFAFVAARWSASVAGAVALGLLATACPLVIAALQDPSQVASGIWMLGIVFPWVIGYGVARQAELALQLEASRRELAQQALLAERRRIARDVHDFVGHGLAGVMLQITSARHVLRRDPDAAEEALRSAEQVGRLSMRELRRTVALLRSDDDQAAPPPLPSALEVAELVDQARTAGLAVELQLKGDLRPIDPGVGVALYRIAQEALANAAKHAPHARTVLRIDASADDVRFVADTTGEMGPATDAEPGRPRYGVIGMRERAAALGGDLSAGPAAGGWRVTCRLPSGDGERRNGGAA